MDNGRPGLLLVAVWRETVVHVGQSARHRFEDMPDEGLGDMASCFLGMLLVSDQVLCDEALKIAQFTVFDVETCATVGGAPGDVRVDVSDDVWMLEHIQEENFSLHLQALSGKLLVDVEFANYFMLDDVNALVEPTSIFDAFDQLEVIANRCPRRRLPAQGQRIYSLVLTYIVSIGHFLGDFAQVCSYRRSN